MNFSAIFPIMSVRPLFVTLPLLILAGGSARGATVLREQYTAGPGLTVPDNDLSGVVTPISTAATSLGSLAKVTVGLNTTGGWNGDMYAYLSHDSVLTTLVNRPGRTASTPDGYSSTGMTLVLDDAAATDVHLASGGLTGTFQPDGRAVAPSASLDTTPRTQTLAQFNTTITGGTWNLFMADAAGGNTAVWQSSTLTLQGDASLSGTDLVKNGTHTTSIVGASDFTGQTIVNGGTLIVGDVGTLATSSGVVVNTGGTLQLAGAGDRIANATPVTLAGGTFATGGLSETVGTLTLTGGGNSVIDLGTGSSFLTFADSSAQAWSGTLSIWNWSGSWGGGGTDRIFFGNGSGTGLTGAQIASIRLYSDSGSTLVPGTLAMMGSGELAPVPEPTAVLSLAALCGVVGWRERRSGQRARRGK